MFFSSSPKLSKPDPWTARHAFQKQVRAAIFAAESQKVHLIDIVNDLETQAADIRFRLAQLPRR